MKKSSALCRVVWALVITTAAGGALGPARSWAQYPERPIRLVYPWPSGSVSDSVVRFFANELGKNINANIVVDNRGGANGIVGTALIAKAKPDGYSLLGTSAGAMVFNPATYKSLPYDVDKDFEALALFSKSYYAMVATASFPARDIPALIALAKKEPSGVKFGVYGLTDMLLTAFEFATGTELNHVPYQGGAPATTATMAGEMNLTFVPAAYSKQYPGRLKALAVGSLQRLAYLPDIPTFAEQGLPGFEMSNWLGIHAPRGIPREAREVVRKAAEQVARSPEYENKLRSMGMEAEYMSPDALHTYIRADTERWQRIVREKKIVLR
jgi:tripartite-type tricarboxylate transporter receptor subunit TctC